MPNLNKFKIVLEATALSHLIEGEFNAHFLSGLKKMNIILSINKLEINEEGNMRHSETTEVVTAPRKRKNAFGETRP